MRIISGKNKGTKLYSLKGESTRPTLDRVKENMFNIISNNIQDSIVLDMFAGSGALGLEALSRGASKAYFVEKNKQAFYICLKNIEKTKNKDNSIVLNMSANDAIFKICKDLSIKNEKIDIVFVDPPYNYDFKNIEKIFEEIENYSILSEDVLIIFESEKKIEKGFLDFEIVDQRKYGRPHLTFLKRKGQ